MIRDRLAQIELSLQAIQSSIGSLEEYKHEDVTGARKKIQEMISKSHKDVQRKCNTAL